MERARPMDRLVCGDVGYGKTEVALRAAFKAVLDQRQVAVLVPTTVLALQHFNTFSERLKPYPVRVELLSRFRSEKEQKEVLARPRRRQGGHRHRHAPPARKRTSPSPTWACSIIDEEQRFGVAHKERLKQLRTEVDVLTLTATPIPRTLHMALANVRDMSVIETPPQERLPIRTYIRELGRRADPRGDPARDRSRRPGLLRPQPRQGHPDRWRSASQRSCPRRASPSATARCPKISSKR